MLESASCAKAASALPKMPLVLWNLAALWIMLVIQYTSSSNLLTLLLCLMHSYVYLQCGAFFLLPNIQSRIAGFVKAGFTKNWLEIKTRLEINKVT